MPVIRNSPYWTTEGRFWPKVDKSGPNGCWLFTGLKDRDGYGKFFARKLGTGTRAHRAAWVLLGRKLTKGLVLDHICRNRTCVNPDHLREITNAENVRAGKSLITHCVRGHELGGSNLGVCPRGYRYCKECKRAAAKKNYKPGSGTTRARAYRERNREKFRAYEKLRTERRRLARAAAKAPP